VIGLDTNILVRLLIEDDPDQTRLAHRLVRNAVAEELCYVSDVALCELEWVLVSCYDASRDEVALAYQKLLDLPGFLFEAPATVRLTLERFRASRVEFSDLLLGARGREKGVRTTYTFEKALSKQDGFTRLV
jgi:predicted nucleic-acid-binding protein